MSEKQALTPREALELQKASLLREAAVKAAEAAKASSAAEAVDRDIAELERLTVLAEKYGFSLTPKPVAPADVPRPQPQPAPQGFPWDGPRMTLAKLIEKYRTDRQSSYNTVRFKTREHYDTVLKGIIESAGDMDVARAERTEILELYNRWTNNGKQKLAMAHSRIAMMRIVSNFCDETLHDPAAKNFSIALHRIRLPRSKRRTERLTEEHARLIIAKAHEMHRPSIALAQAFQFDLPLRQKDCIGEYVPHNEKTPPTDVIVGDKKWVRGLRWEEIDDLFMRHPASFNDEIITADLRKAPFVIKELNRSEGLIKSSGPVIVCESTGQPWIAGEYRRWWRKIARAAGIPDSVKNSDSRNSIAEDDESDREDELSDSEG